ncbi:MAG: hypothetical protein ACI9KE_003935 [Polyangiales bacterium]|jgi:hypothetical protein
MRLTPWMLIVVFAGCGGSYAPMSAMNMEAAGEPMDMAQGMAEEMATPLPDPSPGHSLQASNRPVIEADQASVLPVPSQQRPRLIYTAQLGIVVDHGLGNEAIDRLLAATLQQGGYLSTRNAQTLVVRVPSDRFHQIFAIFEQQGEVSSRSVQVQDVSEEYHDLEVRIESLTTLLARMRALLERTDTLDEVLRIEAELGRIVSEIDQARGRLRFLGSQAAWSTVTLSISERAAPAPNEGPPPPPPRVEPQTVRLPIEWLNQTGLDGLLNLEN